MWENVYSQPLRSSRCGVEVGVKLDRYEPPGGPEESARINKEALRQLGFNI
jgi:hypothetical protein